MSKAEQYDELVKRLRRCSEFRCSVSVKLQGGGYLRLHAIPVPPHGRCIDADGFLNRAIRTRCFRGDYALMLEKLVGESPTIIPASGRSYVNDNGGKR